MVVADKILPGATVKDLDGCEFRPIPGAGEASQSLILPPARRLQRRTVGQPNARARRRRAAGNSPPGDLPVTVADAAVQPASYGQPATRRPLGQPGGREQTGRPRKDGGSAMPPAARLGQDYGSSAGPGEQSGSAGGEDQGDSRKKGELGGQPGGWAKLS